MLSFSPLRGVFARQMSLVQKSFVRGSFAKGSLSTSSCLLAALVLVAAALPGICGAITLDQFDGDQTVVANQNSPISFSAAPSSGTVGGARKLRVSWLSGASSLSLDSNATIVSQGSEGTFLYSQDATVAAQCVLSWDGTLKPTASADMFSNAGLDLLQDGATAFTFEVLSNDLPVQLEVSVTDASDDQKISKGMTTLEAGGARTVSIPFAELSGNADLRKTGSISLLINKVAAPAIDLALGRFGTNGQCNLVPNGSGRVIDECGVCAGNNSSCADCAGAPNGSALVDQCGVCAGDGTSCLDCKGVRNGTALLDRCNVCAGDGTSCLVCASKDITFILATLDAAAKSQEALLRNIYRKIERATSRRSIRRNITSLRKQAHALQIRNWTLAWTIPRISTSCANTTLCASVSNEAFIEEYRRNSGSLRQMSIDALKLWQQVNRKARRHTTSYLRKAAELHADNERELKRVPATQSICG